MSLIPWGEWAPDSGGPDTGIAQTADGVLPRGAGYGPMNAPVVPSGAVALGEDPRGLITIQRQDGAWQDYVATATKIRVLDSSYDWDDIETGRTGPPDGYDTSFGLFGTKLLSTNINDGYKAYDYEAGGTNDTVGDGFLAAEICTCNNVVFLLNVDSNNRKFRSSAVGSHSNFSTLGANAKVFEDGGALLGMRDMRNGAGVMFQESAIRLVQFGSGPDVNSLFSITKVADGLGAASGRPIAAHNGRVWFIANGGGIYEYAVGGEPVAIGDQKVNGWLAGQVSASDLGSIQATADPPRKTTWFRVSATLLLGFHWISRRFFTATVSTLALMRLATPAVVIDDLTGIIDDQTATIDSLDFQGGAPAFGIINADQKVARFTGTPLAADLRSGIFSAQASRRFLQASPISDNSTSTLSLGTSDSPASSLNYSTAATRDGDDGAVRFDDRGRYYAFREQHAAGATWTYSNGVDRVISNMDAP